MSAGKNRYVRGEVSMAMAGRSRVMNLVQRGQGRSGVWGDAVCDGGVSVFRRPG
jgi:hypothetical protein